jgi:hypothetical protein
MCSVITVGVGALHVDGQTANNLAMHFTLSHAEKHRESKRAQPNLQELTPDPRWSAPLERDFSRNHENRVEAVIFLQIGSERLGF